jgi:hypothetical protein
MYATTTVTATAVADSTTATVIDHVYRYINKNNYRKSQCHSMSYIFDFVF